MALFFTILLQIVLSLDPKLVKYAVNCGGETIVTPDGVTYRKDQGYSAGVPSDYGMQFSIRSTKDSKIYQTERYAEEDFTYSIPIVEDGNYVLILRFSEVYFTNSGAKIFNVKIGDMIVVKNLDIFAKVGKAAAYDEFIELSYSDGKLKVRDTEVLGAISNGQIVVTFEKGQQDNPKINAIVLLKGTLDDTHNYEQTERLNQIEREKRAQKEPIPPKKEQRKVEVVDEADFENFGFEFSPEEDESLMTVLTSIPALVIIAFITILGGVAIFSSGGSSSGQEKEEKAQKKSKKKA